MKKLICCITTLLIIWGCGEEQSSSNTTVYTPKNEIVSWLRIIIEAQKQFQRQVVVDQDQDGIGEYGFLQELSGTTNCRVTGKKIDFIILDDSQKTAWQNNGIMKKKDYYFVCYLPRLNSGYYRETSPIPPTLQATSTNRRKAIDEQEKKFLIYAWPIDKKSQKPVYFAYSNEIIMKADNQLRRYSGTHSIPEATAAFQSNGTLLSGEKSSDGQIWSVEN